MKKVIVFILWILSFNPSYATIHIIGVWSGYFSFVPNTLTIELGDTIQWFPYFGNLPTPTDPHTITSTTIPTGATAFDVMWQLPADTFFQYVPQIAGIYNYKCTPHNFMGMNGTFQVVDIANGVYDENSSIVQIKIFPNPSNGRFGIKVDNKKMSMGEFNIEIYNILGEKVYATTSNEIDLSNSSKGIYFVKFYDGKRIRTEKIVIQ